MAKNRFETIFAVVGQDLASKVFRGVGAALGGMGKRAQTADAKLKMVGDNMAKYFLMRDIGAKFKATGQALVGFYGKAISEAQGFGYELANLQGISGATGATLDRLALSAKKVGIETQFTPTQALSALSALAQQGYNATQQMESLTSVIYLAGASGGKVPIAEAAKLTAQTLKAFRQDADQAGITIDRLVKATTMSGLAIEEIAEAMQHAAPAAATFDTSMADALTTVSLIKNIIPSASVAGSAFQIMTSRLAVPAKQQKLRDALGIDVIDEATGNYRRLPEIILDMVSAMENMPTGEIGAVITDVFGPRGQKGIIPLFTQLTTGIQTASGEIVKGRAAVEYWLKSLDATQVEGFAKKMNDLKLDTLHGQIELVKGSIDTFMGELGIGLAGFLKGTAKSFLNVFNPMLEVVMALPTPIKSVAVGFGAMSAAATTLTGTVMLLSATLKMFGYRLRDVGKMFAVLSLGSTGLLALFSGLAIGLYGIARMIKKDLVGATGSWSELWNKVQLGFKALVDLVKHGGLSAAVSEELQKVSNQSMLPWINKLAVWVDNIKSFLGGVTTGLDAGLERLRVPMSILWDNIKKIFGLWVPGGEDAATATEGWAKKGEGLGTILAGVTESVLDLTNKILPAFGEVVGGMTLDGFIDNLRTISRIMGGIVEMVQWLMESLRLPEIAKGLDALGGGWRSITGGDITASEVQRNVGATVASAQSRGVIGQIDPETMRSIQQRSSKQIGQLEEMKQSGLISGESYQVELRKMQDAYIQAYQKAGSKEDTEANAILGRIEAGLIKRERQQRFRIMLDGKELRESVMVQDGDDEDVTFGAGGVTVMQ